MLKGIIILSSERSGSNLLRTLIGNHSNVSAPTASHLINFFEPIKHYYGNLNESLNLRKLFDDMMLVVNHPFNNWGLNLDFNYEEKSKSNISNVIKMNDYLYKKKAQLDKKNVYCSKEIHLFRYLDQLLKNLNDVKFIYLIRDPRDFAASWLSRPMGIHSSYDAAIKWSLEQNKLITFKEDKKFECLDVKYESLVSDTENVMKKVIEYLGLEIEKNCFSTDENHRESFVNPYWKNLSKEIMKDNFNKFHKTLSNRDINIIETLLENEMSLFGYQTVSEKNWRIDPYEKYLINQRIKSKEIEINIIKESMNLLTSKKELLQNIKVRRESEYIESKNTFEKIFMLLVQKVELLIKLIR